MSKQMTPCEKLGYKVGDKFKVVNGAGTHYAVGSFLTLIHDDGSSCPRFNGVHSIFESGDSFFPLDFVEKVAKLKPAKQVLADAIHQNGGWRSGANWACQHGLNRMVVFSASGLAPTRNAARGMACWNSGAIFFGGFQFDRKLPNWHQCALSRDEYFTAYPDQLKVDINNETKHRVEAEMTSESEMTIKVSSAGAVAGGDWHKNGELPPVGEVCEWLECKQTGWQEVIVAGYYMNSAWIVPKGKEPITVFNPTGFRALRTEREKAIDEMMNIAAENWGNLQDCCERLYEYGYRKEVK